MSQQGFTLRLPFPPSVNQLYTKGKRLTKKARAFYRDAAALIIMQGYKNHQWSDPCDICLTLYFPHHGDTDNRLKCAQDALTKAGVWTDDKLVRDIQIKRRKDPDKEGYCTIEIIPIIDEEEL